MDIFDRIMELSRYGYFCGQILAILMQTPASSRPWAGSTAAWAFRRAAAAA